MTVIDLASILVLLLASYRLSILLADTDEGGPWGSLTKLRQLAGVRFDKYSNPEGTTMVSSALLCTYCNSVWIGLFWTLAYLLFGSIAIWLALPLALSGGAVLLAGRS